MLSQIVLFITIALAASLLLMVAAFFLQKRLGNAGLVDIVWAYGVGATVFAYALLAPGDNLRRLVVAALCGMWSLRLGTYLLRDRILRGEEDGRYKTLMNQWGDRAQKQLFVFYVLQAAFVVFFAMSALPALFNDQPFGTVTDWLGVAVWAVALLGERLADSQLAAWRHDESHKGKTCRAGLWRYSRHPNYFFEWLHWWGYGLMALYGPLWWAGLWGPVVVLLFVYRLTGIPYTEEQALRTRGQDYADYQASTSSFLPWFPKENVHA